MGTLALACPGVISNGMIAEKFCVLLFPPPDPPLLGSPSEVPDDENDDDDDLEALVFLGLMFNVF